MIERNILPRWVAGASLALVLCLTPTVRAQAWETTLHTFKGVPDGSSVSTAMVVDQNGTLFGVARYGGSDPTCECGVVFMLKSGVLGSPTGGPVKLTIIHQFKQGAAGFWPSGLALDGEGGLYGVTYVGGQTTADCSLGCGTVFRLRPPSNGATNWIHTVLYRFKDGRDGSRPNHNLVVGKDGSLFGVTGFGGGNAACAEWSDPPSCGVVFQLKPVNAAKTVWRETVLHRFTGRDGGNSQAGLAIDAATGTLYGTTWVGGSKGNGTVFRLIPPGDARRSWRFDTIYTFKDDQDGWGPNGALALSKGVLYGATTAGGQFDAGTVFQLTAPASGNGPWRQTTLYAARPDQANWPIGVTMGANGSLYVPSFLGGTVGCSSGCGAIFKLVPPARSSKKWSFVSLHRFSGSDGEAPSGPVTLIGHHVYGSTQQGGDYSACNGGGCGVLFDMAQ